jgi:hypothetical protein
MVYSATEESPARERFFRSLGLEPRNVRSCIQVHSRDVLFADSIGEGRSKADGLVAGDARDIIVQAQKSMLVLINMLNVIINRAPPGAYMGLANFKDLAEKNQNFQEGISASVNSLKEALQIMETIDKVDNGR